MKRLCPPSLPPMVRTPMSVAVTIPSNSHPKYRVRKRAARVRPKRHRGPFNVSADSVSNSQSGAPIAATRAHAT